MRAKLFSYHPFCVYSAAPPSFITSGAPTYQDKFNGYLREQGLHEGGFKMGPFELMDLVGVDVGLDVARFSEDLASHAGAVRVAEDVDSADLSGVSGTPTFFVNGRRHYGAYDIDALSGAVRVARARATLAR